MDAVGEIDALVALNAGTARFFAEHFTDGSPVAALLSQAVAGHPATTSARSR